MTRQRNDDKSTEFGIWLRQVKELDSHFPCCFAATNIDYMWECYRSHLWMYIEEKRFNTNVKSFQSLMFSTLDHAAKNDPRYRGFHFIKFENTNPEDGLIWLDDKQINKQELILFLQFAQPDDWYVTFQNFRHIRNITATPNIIHEKQEIKGGHA